MAETGFGVLHVFDLVGSEELHAVLFGGVVRIAQVGVLLERRVVVLERVLLGRLELWLQRVG